MAHTNVKYVEEHTNKHIQEMHTSRGANNTMKAKIVDINPYYKEMTIRLTELPEGMVFFKGQLIDIQTKKHFGGQQDGNKTICKKTLY